MTTDPYRRHESTGTKYRAVLDEPPVFVRGEGARLYDARGRAWLDFACGSGTTSLGHGHPVVQAAIAAQLATGITHIGPHFHGPVQGRLYERLARLLPPEIACLHPATNGTEATEVALKAAMHATGATTFVGFEGGYHGRTMGALAVSGERGRNARLAPFRPEAVILRWPETAAEVDGALGAIDAAARQSPLAGIILEPWQATAGMRPAAPGLLRALRRWCDGEGVPLILDEVFTGFARTGTPFAFLAEGVVPDLLILAKSLGGGLPAGLVAGRPGILQAWAPGTQSSTFQLHPLAAAASLAFLDVLEAEDLPARARAIRDLVAGHHDQIRASACVATVRGVGAMHGVEIVDPATGCPDQPRCARIRRAALEAGLVTWECGTQGHVIGLVPPLVIGTNELEEGLDLLVAAIRTAG